MVLEYEIVHSKAGKELFDDWPSDLFVQVAPHNDLVALLGPFLDFSC